ncbi:MAG: hypothetical protein RI973_1639 [Bacteroidota bacterium]|jgi:hypothetical protein
MTSRITILTLASLLVLATACKNDEEARDQAAESVSAEVAALNAPLSKPIGKLALPDAEKILLDNNQEILLPEKNDTSLITLFIVRNAESQEGKTSLSNTGLARAGYLANIMEKITLDQVFVDGNAAMQTGLFSSQANQVDLSIYQGEKIQDFISLLLGNFKGKRVLVSTTPGNLPALLNALSGKIVEGKMPSEEYDHLYVVKFRKVGDAEIFHLIY